MDGTEVIGTILSSSWTPATLSLACVALIVTAFVRGWIQPRGTVEQILQIQNLRIEEAIKRGDDYRVAWELSEKRGDVLQGVVDQLSGVTVTVNKVLDALPAPRSGGEGGRVDT